MAFSHVLVVMVTQDALTCLFNQWQWSFHLKATLPLAKRPLKPFNQWQWSFHSKAALHGLKGLTSLLTNGSAAFIWKLNCHWLKGFTKLLTGIWLYWYHWLPLAAPTMAGSSSSTGIILCMRPVNERRRYNITSSLIGWAHSQNGPW